MYLWPEDCTYSIELSCGKLKFGGWTSHLSRDRLISCSRRSCYILSRPRMLWWHVMPCDKILLKRRDCKEVLTLMMNSMSLLGMTTLEINRLWRDLIKHKLLLNLNPFVKDVPPGFQLLFGDDINERIGQISSNNSELHRGDRDSNSHSKRDNHHKKNVFKNLPSPPKTFCTREQGLQAEPQLQENKLDVSCTFIADKVKKNLTPRRK